MALSFTLLFQLYYSMKRTYSSTKGRIQVLYGVGVNEIAKSDLMPSIPNSNVRRADSRQGAVAQPCRGGLPRREVLH